MKGTDPARARNWHIIESGDRWYQAVLRFTLSEAARLPGTIRRWDAASATALITGAGQDQTGRLVLLWEIPAQAKPCLWTLEAMATIRRTNPRAVQLAHLPARRWSSSALVVQEAGATFLLDDLWTLEKIIGRLAG